MHANRSGSAVHSVGSASVRLLLLTLTLFWCKHINVCSRYSDSLLAGRTGNRIPVGNKFSASAQIGLRGHPASCIRGTGFLCRDKAAGAWLWPPISTQRQVYRISLNILLLPFGDFASCSRVTVSYINVLATYIAWKHVQCGYKRRLVWRLYSGNILHQWINHMFCIWMWM